MLGDVSPAATAEIVWENNKLPAGTGKCLNDYDMMTR